MKHINFADLRVFLAIAYTGNLTRAAAQCCITPRQRAFGSNTLKKKRAAVSSRAFPAGSHSRPQVNVWRRRLERCFSRSPK